MKKILKNILTIIAIVLITMLNNLIHAQACVDTNQIYKFNNNGKKYELVKELKTWAEACSCAIMRGGYLVQIEDSLEQVAIYSAIINSGVSTTYNPVSDGGGTSYIWIGASDLKTEGDWLWDGNNDGNGLNFWDGQGAAGNASGSAINGLYNNWGKDAKDITMEPDDYGGAQDAAAMALAGWPSGTTLLGKAGQWNDISHTNTLYYIIEFENTGIDIQTSNAFNHILKIFPNPTNNAIRISHPENYKLIRIYSMEGKEILTISQAEFLHSESINVSSLQHGSFQIMAEDFNGFLYTSRFIKLP